MKTCTKCKEKKPLTEYHRDKTQEDLRKLICKKCISIYNCARYFHKVMDAEHFEKYSYSREQHLKDMYPSVSYSSFTSSMSRKGVKISNLEREEFNWFVEDFVANSRSYSFGGDDENL